MRFLVPFAALMLASCGLPGTGPAQWTTMPPVKLADLEEPAAGTRPIGFQISDGDVKVVFNINLKTVSPIVSEVIFEIDGQRRVYRNEKEFWYQFTWPGGASARTSPVEGCTRTTEPSILSASTDPSLGSVSRLRTPVPTGRCDGWRCRSR